MLKLILVPLDGSSFGEQALPLAIQLARRDHAEIELVHVYDYLRPYQVSGAPPLDPLLDLELLKDRRQYLERTAEWVRKTSELTVRAAMLDGPVARTLIAYVAERDADLVVMATHGRGGLSRLWLGSVASDVVRDSEAPVLLIRPTETGSRQDAAPTFRRVLIPLDGSTAGEEAIDHVISAVGTRDVTYVVLRVVTPVFYLAENLAAVDPDADEMREEEKYAAEVAGRLRALGIAVETRILTHTQPPRAILEFAEESRVDLIAMETHGRHGIDRILLGSVTDKVVRGASVPVLVHRARAVAALAGTGGAAGERGEGGPRA